jgi:hypothetical protein
MTIKKTEPQYKTSDGKLFDTAEQAERYEKLTAALQEYDSARDKLTRAFIGAQATADGKPVEISYATSYWVITGSFDGMRYIAEIYFSFYKIEADPYKEDELGFYHPASDGKRKFWRFSDLYAVKENAERALLAEQKETMKHWQADIAKLERKLGEG